MSELKALPKEKKYQARFYTHDDTINLHPDSVNFAYITCPACRTDHLHTIGVTFDCCVCGAKIKIPPAVRVK